VKVKKERNEVTAREVFEPNQRRRGGVEEVGEIAELFVGGKPRVVLRGRSG